MRHIGWWAMVLDSKKKRMKSNYIWKRKDSTELWSWGIRCDKDKVNTWFARTKNRSEGDWVAQEILQGIEHLKQQEHRSHSSLSFHLKCASSGTAQTLYEYFATEWIIRGRLLKILALGENKRNILNNSSAKTMPGSFQVPKCLMCNLTGSYIHNSNTALLRRYQMLKIRCHISDRLRLLSRHLMRERCMVQWFRATTIRRAGVKPDYFEGHRNISIGFLGARISPLDSVESQLLICPMIL